MQTSTLLWCNQHSWSHLPWHIWSGVRFRHRLPHPWGLAPGVGSGWPCLCASCWSYSGHSCIDPLPHIFKTIQNTAIFISKRVLECHGMSESSFLLQNLLTFCSLSRSEQKPYLHDKFGQDWFTNIGVDIGNLHIVIQTIKRFLLYFMSL